MAQADSGGSSGYVFVIDHTGTIAAHPKLNLQDRQSNEYAAVGLIEEALHGQLRTTKYRDPLAQHAMIATFTPVPVGEDVSIKSEVDKGSTFTMRLPTEVIAADATMLAVV